MRLGSYFTGGITPGTARANKALVPDDNKDLSGLRNLTVTGNIVSSSQTISPTELGYLDGAGLTVVASKVVVADADKDIVGVRKIWLGTNGAAGFAGELDIQDGANPGVSAALTYADLVKIDAITDGTVAAGKAFVAGTGGNILNIGTSGTPWAMGTTADKKLLSLYADTTALTGDARLIYGQLKFSGAGGSGEALRVKGTVNNVLVATGGTVNGAHISLEITGASGQISGAGHALRATLDLGALNNPGGTIDVMQLDTNIAADATIPATTAFLSLSNEGTGKLGYFLRTSNMDTSAFFTTAGTGANSAGLAGGGIAAKALKINIDGVDYWIGLFSSNSN